MTVWIANIHAASLHHLEGRLHAISARISTRQSVRSSDVRISEVLSLRPRSMYSQVGYLTDIRVQGMYAPLLTVWSRSKFEIHTML
jgi:hypothetical protein